MQKRAPTLGNMFVIILFVLSCFGLLLFLWESFGGPLPLKPKGYQFTVAFPHALPTLAEQSDVRISGVDVGHIVAIKTSKKSGLTEATVELAGRYAPVRANMHAILRQKTLLGETYLQLIPEGQTGPFLRDGGQLAQSQVEPEVTLDGLLSAFDPKTRADFQIWQQALAEGINGRGEQINASFATLEPFVEHANQLVGHPRHPGRGRARAGAQHRASCSTRSPGATTSSKADRQRRTHLPRGRRRQPGVRGSLPRAAGLRAQLDRGAQRTRPLRRRFQPVPRTVPTRPARALAAA